ncbi:Dam family site-specific DNA-(adenine-N6)-methyltransferase [Lactococcus garvieae]|uniref:Dam family site-specific DNA-(adenine-N6)-methyltransferase n=3 Tax=Lactococcus garvieae TaxID=1363 RepID=UPI0005AB720B|nr:Dam family site-specific DNA-(adenine-N6)-methyltransferase [Lactococcus garvieae]MDG6192237.1 Dam family site-specific DNA-(adenine-N6)-methyltransferase [Lactococcus garvieae]PCS02375.1 DNA adenine methylase [Lactococcus garvieae]
MKNPFLKSALNYTGGKYRLLPQLFPLFPEANKFERFIDLFAGGGVVSVNMAREYQLENYDIGKDIVVNDIEPHVISLLNYLSKENIDNILEKIYFYIRKYGLSDTEKYGYEPYLLTDKRDVSAFNKEKYKILRDDYNMSVSEDIDILFYLLIVFGFNNQVRFNSKGQFNLPVGKRDFNSQMKSKLISFQEVLSSNNFDFRNQDFRNIIDVSKDDFIYADPPYRITTAAYNERGGWTTQDDLDLFDYLDKIDSIGAKFALSNVVAHKGKINSELVEWSKKYGKFSKIPLKFDYNNSNYQSKAKHSETIEVLIKNY